MGCSGKGTFSREHIKYLRSFSKDPPMLFGSFIHYNDYMAEDIYFPSIS